MIPPGEKLKRARRALDDITQEALQVALGYDEKSRRVSDYERGKAQPTADFLRRWDRVYGNRIPSSYITDGRDVPAIPNGQFAEDVTLVAKGEEDRFIRTLSLPYYGEAPAGDFEADENHRVEYLKVSEELHHPDRFILRVSGKSMEKALLFGDIVHFHKSKIPRDGVIVLAQKDGGRTIKVARFRPATRDWILQAFNEDFYWPLSEWEMMGYLVTVRRRGKTGLQETYHEDQGIRPEQLPQD